MPNGGTARTGSWEIVATSPDWGDWWEKGRHVEQGMKQVILLEWRLCGVGGGIEESLPGSLRAFPPVGLIAMRFSNPVIKIHNVGDFKLRVVEVSIRWN